MAFSIHALLDRNELKLNAHIDYPCTVDVKKYATLQSINNAICSHVHSLFTVLWFSADKCWKMLVHANLHFLEDNSELLYIRQRSGKNVPLSPKDEGVRSSIVLCDFSDNMCDLRGVCEN